MDQHTHQLGLPNVIIHYILRHFLDLGDVWCLSQVSRQLRSCAFDTIQHYWKIDLTSTPETSIKTQCRAALIALERLSNQLSIQQHQYESPRQNYATTRSHGDDDSKTMNDLDHATNTTTTITITATDHVFLLHALDDDNSNSSNHDPLQGFLLQEEQLHQRILHGLRQHMKQGPNRYELLKTDNDCRKLIRDTVDIVFHHTVFVSAITRYDGQQQLNGHHPLVVVMMVRLLIRLDTAFPCFCREITYTLTDLIKSFLEFTQYQLSAHHASACQCDLLKVGHRPTDAPQKPCVLPIVRYRISACFDLLGAAWIGKIIHGDLIERTVLRVCDLLTDDGAKKDLLLDLLNGWLRTLSFRQDAKAGDLCSLVQSEIDKC